MISCNSPICLECALELFDFLKTSDSVIQECGFCNREMTQKDDEHVPSERSEQELENMVIRDANDDEKDQLR